MYLARASTKGFRRLENLEVRFTKGLNVLVGPNNAGKSAVIDALRVLLTVGEDGALRVSSDDLRLFKGVKEKDVTFHYVFAGLTDSDEADFLTALKPIPGTNPVTYEAHISVRYSESADTSGRMRVKRWCGDHEETPVTAEMLEDLRAVYLPPLRDPEQGLKPGRGSQLSKLIKGLSDVASQAEIVQLLKDFDNDLKTKPPIKNTQTAIVKRHTDMLGELLAQQLKIGLSPTDFLRLASRLSIAIADFEVEQNGLGYNNLIYMAVVLSELALNKEAAYCALIVEEPEAHLHPQLQAVLLDYLRTVENPVDGENAVQIFVTSHSPNFAALASIDSISCIYEAKAGVQIFFPREIKFEKKKKEKLQRYLNVTRAELFFARRIIFVEGAAELFLVDACAQKLNIDLRKHAISIISVEGLNFDCFLPFFAKDFFEIPVAVITDSDPPKSYPPVGDPPELSAAAKSIESAKNEFIKPFFATKTLEYDLALYPPNIATMLSALKDIHPGIGADLETAVNAAGKNEKAKVLFMGMFERGEGKTNIKKGEFGQALAQAVLVDKLEFEVPAYIAEAFSYVTGK
jgi:putative ATP-dependent endonuclease of OLD family